MNYFCHSRVFAESEFACEFASNHKVQRQHADNWNISGENIFWNCNLISFSSQYEYQVLDKGDGDISWTMISRGHFFSKWANSHRHFLKMFTRIHPFGCTQVSTFYVYKKSDTPIKMLLVGTIYLNI